MNISYSDFMRGMTNVPFDYGKCEKCGGTGYMHIFCCDGRMCGCQGGAVDFKECDCSCQKLSNEYIIQCIPEKYKENK